MSAPNGTVGWGFIGASTVAGEHMVGAVRAQSGHEVVAIASSQMARAQGFAKTHAIASAYDSVAALLADPKVHVVYISTTNELHRDQVLAAAAACKHVLCEKPLALNLADAMAMVQACRDAGVLMATNHHLRNAATHRRVRDMLQSGAIGKPLFARVFHAVHLPAHLQGWRIDRPEAGGGVILDITVHDIDTLRFVLGAEPVEAVGMTQSTEMAREGLADGVMAVVRFDNGVLVQLHDAFTVKHAGTGIEIHGDAGSIIGRNVMTQQPVGDLLLRDRDGECAVAVEPESLYARGVGAFCAALRGNGAPAATGEDGVRSLAGALAVAQACRTGTAVRISNPFQ
jgi:1,5-anhydro-D-fructose reductase (1,5-anhydro-D-mannitol-forming)